MIRVANKNELKKLLRNNNITSQKRVRLSIDSAKKLGAKHKFNTKGKKYIYKIGEKNV